MKKTIFFFFLLLTSVQFAQQQDTLIFKADYIPYPDTVMVVKPADYNTGTEYPVVYLLHGWTGYWSYWNEISNLDSLASVFNMIIVCPDGFSDSWYIDSPLKKNVQFEKFYWGDLIPYIEENYSINRQNVFITGLSMGGHGALTLFLKNPEYFHSAGSMSGILDLTHFPDRWSIKEGIGSIKDYPEVWEENSAINLLGNIKGTDKKIIVECGTEDFAYEVNEKFAERCEEKNIDCTFVSRPGTHNRTFWNEAIGGHLKFFKEQISE